MSTTLMCLAMAIYFEARAEPLEGQYAVAEVIMNRTEDPRFPDTVCGVVEQEANGSCQFSFYCDGKPEVFAEKDAYDTALLVAFSSLYSPYFPRFADGALYFHSTGVSPSWAESMTVTAEVGKHVFLSDAVTKTGDDS